MSRLMIREWDDFIAIYHVSAIIVIIVSPWLLPHE